ncbi:MAG: helix-turn-helix transcriptional regulator [Candidatus Promineifilaceae bacterium]
MQVTDSHLRDAFKALQKHNQEALAASPLHGCGWMQICRWESEPNNITARGLQLKILLHWVVHQLAPDPITSTEKGKENQRVLQRRYLEAKNIVETAAAEQIAEPTVYTRTKRALKMCAKLLNTLPEDALLKASCDQLGAQLRYESVSKDVQIFLQQLAIYQVPFAPADLLHAPALIIEDARQRGLVIGETQVEIHPRLRVFVAETISAEQQQRWSAHAAQRMLRHGNIWQAHQNLFGSGQYLDSAELLIQHETTLLQFATLNQILNAIDAYQPKSLPPIKWTRLKLLAARCANRAASQQVALDHLRHANSDHPTFQAYASLHRAIVSRNSDQQVALEHFARCMAQSKQVRGVLHETLLAELYLRRTGVHLADPHDLVSAEADLAAAKKLIANFKLPKHLHILMHNAEGRINARKKRWGKTIACYEAGLQLAREINDVQSKIFLTHNIGGIKTRQEQESLGYLLEGHTLAQEIGDQSSLAYFEKMIGAYYFHKKRYDLSVKHNRIAYQLFSKLGNLHATAHTCFDLAETLIQTSHLSEAKTYFAHAQHYAQANQTRDLASECSQLAKVYPELIHPINTRQQTIIQSLREHDAMTQKAFLQLTGLSKSSFHRAVSALVQMGVVQKSGRGRATVYSKSFNR